MFSARYMPQSPPPAEPKYSSWLGIPIIFDRRDRKCALHSETTALVLDPIVDGFHLTKVMMDDDNSLNLIYADTMKMQFDES